MLDFIFQNTTKIIFGKDAELKIGEEASKITNKTLIIGTGELIFEPLINKIKQSLADSDVESTFLGGVKPNPEIDIVYKAIDICKEKGIGLVIAVGGGSVIDTAKAVGAGVLYDGDVWDLFLRKASFSKALPVATVVTIAATGSESSNGAVISNSKQGLKMDIMDNCLRPAFSILNPELTFTLPEWHTFCGIADIMSHTMERYFTSTEHVELIDRMSEGLLASCIHNARIIKRDPKNYDARAEIMWAATLSHNDLLGTGRVGDWASHWIGMAVSAIYDTTHGATLSIITPAWMKHVYKNNTKRFAQFAVRVFGVEYDVEYPELTALEGINRLESFFNEIGAPTRLSQVGITDENQYQRMADIFCTYGARGCIKYLEAKDVIEILRLAK